MTRSVWCVLAAWIFSAAMNGATLVLKGGRRLEVGTVERKGQYVEVHCQDGRSLSYPLSVVDWEATTATNTADPRNGVARSLPTDAQEGTAGTRQFPLSASGRVLLRGHSHASGIRIASIDAAKVGAGRWEVTPELSNDGRLPLVGLQVAVQLRRDDNWLLSESVVTVSAALEPGSRTSVRVSAESRAEPSKIDVEVTCCERTPVNNRGRRDSAECPGTAITSAEMSVSGGQLAEKLEQGVFVQVVEGQVEILTEPESSPLNRLAVGRLCELFEYRGEEGQWYKINMFSGDWRYLPKAGARLVRVDIRIPETAASRRLVYRALLAAEARAEREVADVMPPSRLGSRDLDLKVAIKLERQLDDSYKLDVLRQCGLQPPVYRRIAVEGAANDWE